MFHRLQRCSIVASEYFNFLRNWWKWIFGILSSSEQRSRNLQNAIRFRGDLSWTGQYVLFQFAGCNALSEPVIELFPWLTMRRRFTTPSALNIMACILWSICQGVWIRSNCICVLCRCHDPHLRANCWIFITISGMVFRVWYPSNAVITFIDGWSSYLFYCYIILLLGLFEYYCLRLRAVSYIRWLMEDWHDKAVRLI